METWRPASPLLPPGPEGQRKPGSPPPLPRGVPWDPGRQSDLFSRPPIRTASRTGTLFRPVPSGLGHLLAGARDPEAARGAEPTGAGPRARARWARLPRAQSAGRSAGAAARAPEPPSPRGPSPRGPTPRRRVRAFPKARLEEPRPGALARKGAGAGGNRGRRPPGRGPRARAPAAPRSPPRLPAARAAPRSAPPPRPAPRHRAREGGGAEAEPAPAPAPAPDWLLRPSIPDHFGCGGGVPPSLPQITFATGSQPVGPESAGKKRLGASEFGPAAPRPGPPARVPPARPRPYILPSAATHPSRGRSGGLAVRPGRNGASRGSRLDARLGRGCGGHAGGRGGVMRRGGALHPPRPRVPAATRQAPPLLPSERQGILVHSCFFPPRALGPCEVSLLEGVGCSTQILVT